MPENGKQRQCVLVKQKANKQSQDWASVEECGGEDMHKNVEVLAQHLPVLK